MARKRKNSVRKIGKKSSIPSLSIQKLRSILRIAGHSLIVAGLCLAVFGGVLTLFHYNPNRLSFKNSHLEKKQQLADNLKIPKKITIRAINVNLPIIPSTIRNGVWETTDKGVSYLIQSPVPGTYGNSILYGHNWTKLLGGLTQMKPGQTFEIEYSDGSIETFTIQTTAYVLPTDISVLRDSAKPLVTLYTCAGPLDSKRFVVTARPS